MTEGAALVLRADGSVTGFNQAMETGVPEPQTWAMLAMGFGLLALLGVKRRGARNSRLSQPPRGRDRGRASPAPHI